jgi:hypothetical protein
MKKPYSYLKKAFLLASILLPLIPVSAQDFAWAKRFGIKQMTSHLHTGFGFDQSGHPIVAGTSIQGSTTAFTIYKTDKSSGTTLLTKTYNNTFVAGETAKGYQIFSDASDNIFFLGQKKGTLTFGSTVLAGLNPENPNEDFILLKFDSEGNYLWGQEFGIKKSDDDNAGIVYAGLDGNEISIITATATDSFFYNTTFVEKLPNVPNQDIRNYSLLRINTTNGTLTKFERFGQYKYNRVAFLKQTTDGTAFELTITEQTRVSDYDLTRVDIATVWSLSKEGVLTNTNKKISIKAIAQYTSTPFYNMAIHAIGSNYYLFLSGAKNAQGIIGTQTITSPNVSEASVLNIFPLNDDFEIAGDRTWIASNSGYKVWNHLPADKFVIESTIISKAIVNEVEYAATLSTHPSSAFFVIDGTLALEDYYDYGNTNSETYVRSAQVSADGELFVLINSQGDVKFGSLTVKADGKSWLHMTALTKRGALVSTGLQEAGANGATAFYLYPNPAQESFSVQYHSLNTQDKIVGVKVLDIYGRIVQESFSSENINIEKLDAGIYTVAVQTQERPSLDYYKIVKK